MKGCAHAGTGRPLTVDEAVEVSGVGRSTVYGLMESGDPPSVKFGRCRRIEYSEILRLIRRNRTGDPGQTRD